MTKRPPSAFATGRLPLGSAVIEKSRLARYFASLFFTVLMLTLVYFVGAEQGATSLISGEDVHEWVHDGRHLLGFPCH